MSVDMKMKGWKNKHMNIENEQEFIQDAFFKLLNKGWIKGDLKPSLITKQDIEKLEDKYQIEIPSLYKEFLMAYQLPKSIANDHLFEISGIVNRDKVEGLEPLWLILNRIKDVKSLEKIIDEFRSIAIDYCEAPEGSYLHFLPIGDWGAGWGPLCIDLKLAKKKANKDDESTWSLVWFDHEEFDWKEEYLKEDGLLYGRPAVPDFQTLLEWYFIGALEQEFENQYQLKLDVQKLSSFEFCGSYWEDKWKDNDM